MRPHQRAGTIIFMRNRYRLADRSAVISGLKISNRFISAPADDAIDGPTQQNIRNDRQKDRDGQHFAGINPANDFKLIDSIEDHRQNKNLAYAFPCTLYQFPSMFRTCGYFPEI